MVIKIGLIVNPIAGMGGRVGLKGTDGVLEKAIKLGATPVSPIKIKEMLKKFTEIFSNDNTIKWYTTKGIMGSDYLDSIGIKNYEIVYKPKTSNTNSTDTKKTCKIFYNKKVDLILFCGGDGTARNIFEIIGNKIPILGIPSGVKMHSGAFGINTSATAKILNDFVKKNLTIGDIEIMDLDEDLYRKGEWNIRLFGVAKGIVEPTYIQVGKSTYDTISNGEIKDELYEHIMEEMENHTEVLYLFGPGGTIDYIAHKLNLDNTLLGIDAVYNKKIIGKDLNEIKLLNLLAKYQKAKLILSPIGAQGFILGRGNLQLSPKVVKKIGIDNIIVLSTPSKLKNTPVIRVDTGDRELDKQFAELDYILVVTGYRFSRVIKIQTNNF